VSAEETSRPDFEERPVRPGDLVGHYEILGVVGQGGMGVVFRARDRQLQRDVALKCPWPRLASDPEARSRFLREARAAARLSHPNVVPVFEIFEWQGLPWVAMDLVEGEPLAHLLAARRPLPLGRILLCAEGIAGALAAAHAKGILHRDLNPNNILVRPDGWAMLTDFGLAHLLTPEAGESATTITDALSRPGQLLGTRCYMAPEQVLGRRLDARCDLFAFGAVLYEMCAGRRAFEASEPGEEFDAILHRDPPPLAPLNPEIPEELEQIARRALAKRPADRHPDAEALRQELAELRRRVESADVGELLRSGSSARRAAAWRGGLAAALLVIAVLALVWALRSRERAGGLVVGTPRQVTGDRGWEAEPALSPDGSLIAYSAGTGAGSDLWLADTRGASRLRLTDDPAHDRTPAWFPDGSELAFVSDRGGADAIWKLPRLGGAAVLLVPNAIDPAISPDGTRIAFARPDAAGVLRIAVAPLADPARARWLSSERDSPWVHRQPAWSPDGGTICFTDQRDLWLVDADGGRRAARLTRDNAVDLDPVFSSDGHQVVFSSYRQGTLALWRVAVSGGLPERLTVGSGPEGHPSVSRDGTHLAYTTYLHDYDVALVERATGERGAIRTLLAEAAPAFAPDGDALVYVGSGRGVTHQVWRQVLAGVKPRGSPQLVTDVGDATNTPAYSPDGAWIAFKRERQGRREIWIVPAAGGPAERFSDGAGDDANPAWSADGRRLAFASSRTGTLKIWAAPVESGRRAGAAVQLTAGEGTDFLPAWSWDGRWLTWVRSVRDAQEVWIATAQGGAPRRLVTGDQIGRLRFERATGRLWYCVSTAGGPLRLASVAPGGGAPQLAAEDLIADSAVPGDFDLSPTGDLLAYTREEVRGDLWLLEAREGSY
jgi:Tol biopolymer transport system component